MRTRANHKKKPDKSNLKNCRGPDLADNRKFGRVVLRLTRNCSKPKTAKSPPDQKTEIYPQTKFEISRHGNSFSDQIPKPVFKPNTKILQRPKISASHTSRCVACQGRHERCPTKNTCVQHNDIHSALCEPSARERTRGAQTKQRRALTDFAAPLVKPWALCNTSGPMSALSCLPPVPLCSALCWSLMFPCNWRSSSISRTQTPEAFPLTRTVILWERNRGSWKEPLTLEQEESRRVRKTIIRTPNLKWVKISISWVPLPGWALLPSARIS